VKITYLKAVNFAGIYAGTGRREIEIDFTKGNNKIVMLLGGNGSGKAQPNDSIIYTPDGFKLMGDIKKGDYVFSEKGLPIRVVHVYPQGKLNVFRVHFNDGTFMDCNDEHLFKVMKLKYRRNKEKYFMERVMSVKEIIKSGLYTGNTLKYYIPMTEPVHFETRDLFIHPYVMGCLLADGGLSGDTITFSNSETDVINKFKLSLHSEYELVFRNNYDYALVKKARGANTNLYNDALKKLGLSGLLSHEKFIPDEYKYNSIDVRLQLLQGLLDCDGSVEKKNSIYYYTTSKKLAEDVKFLVESLGGTSTIYEKPITFTYKGETKKGKLNYRVFIKKPVNLNVFTSIKHNEKYNEPKMYINPHRKIKSIENLNMVKEMTCIKVDSDEELYLTNNFIVTHNTSVLSIAHPYRETNDQRKSIIVPNENGYKEVHLSHKNDKYIVKHYYGSSNKSFFEKNGKELNENGGIRLFNELVENEFNIDKDYFQIARLGSNVDTFIDRTVSERKSYINKLLPNIDEYFEGFEIVNTKVKDTNSLIKTINNQLDRLDDKSLLLEKLETSKKHNDKLKEDISKILEKINVSMGILESTLHSYNIKPEEFSSRYTELETKLNDAKESLNKNSKMKKMYLDKYSNLSKYSKDDITNIIFDVKNEIRQNQDELKQIKNKINDYNLRVLEYDNNIASQEKLLVDESSLPDLIALQQSINDDIEKALAEKEKQYEEISNSLEFTLTGSETSEDLKDIINIIKTIESQYENKIWSNYDNELFDIFNLDYYSSKLNEYHESIAIEERLINDIKVLNQQIKTIESSEYLLKTLEKRPDDCIIDSCAFIVKAVDYKENEFPLLERKSIELNSKETELNKVQEKIESLKIIISFYEDIESNIVPYIAKLNITQIPTIGSYYHSFFSLKKYNMNIMTIQSILSDLQKLNGYLKLDSYIIERKYKLETVTDKVKTIESSKKSNEQINANISDFKQKIIDIKESINNLNIEYTETEGQLNKNENRLKIYNGFSQILSNVEASEKIVSNNEMQFNELVSIKEKVESLQKDIDDYKILHLDLNAKLEPLIKEEEAIKKDLIIIDSALENLEKAKENYEEMLLVRDALDPKKGIPLIFIEMYLTDIEYKTNELLNLAYGGEFKIKFDISATDFYIRIEKSNGDSLDDVKLASQGETSLTVVSLSLGMIEKIMLNSKYNILYLDEIDSTLSTKNRRLFISMLEKQIERLGIEQVFVISHNNEFESYPIDMILMKENNVDTEDQEFMENKNVIYKY